MGPGSLPYFLWQNIKVLECCPICAVAHYLEDCTSCPLFFCFTLALALTIVPLITTFSLEIVLLLWLAFTATHLWKMLSTMFCSVQCTLLIVLLYLPLLPTYWEIKGSGLDKKKIEWFLFGSLDLQFQSNVRLFAQVQSFISHSSGFS